MNITLNQEEIKEALVAYVGNQGIALEGKSIGVSMVAGRKGNGYSAEIAINKKVDDCSGSDQEVISETTSIIEQNEPALLNNAETNKEEDSEESSEEPDSTATLFGQ